jgi:hypothetical protein
MSDDSDEEILGITDKPIAIYSRNTSANYDNYETYSKTNRYRHLRESGDVKGYIVNTHDPTNYDIDFEMTPELRDRYNDVITTTYTYKDMPDDFLTNPDLEGIDNIPPKVGTAYRCRLRGVGINQTPIRNHKWKMSQACVDIRQLIDRSDGWVVCTLTDVDVYRRMLVDIKVITNNGPIVISDFLLNKKCLDDTPLFYPYSKH